jgi:2-octaprenyl-6-methoxyphenol hydroxylase
MLDVAIVGAGPVGAALAALLAHSGLDIAVFEARAGASSDARILALSHGSRERLEEAGAWPGDGVTPITSIHVSQRGGPGRTRIEAREQGLPALGYTVAFNVLESALARRLQAEGVAVHFGVRCNGIALEPGHASLSFEAADPVEAKLLVLADGGANAARIPGIAFASRDYGQSAVVSRVRCDREHGGRAFERFTAQGPMAMLPLPEGYALVWTVAPEEVEALLGATDADFLERLQDRFGDRAGRFIATGPRASFPLRLRSVNSPTALRTALIGNAAQALHPIAGQGLNLGLRDATQLAAAILATAPDDIGGAAMLESYRNDRRRDAGRGVAFTDLLVSLFGDDRRLPTWGRGLALTAFDLFPGARRLLAERMIHGAPAP